MNYLEVNLVLIKLSLVAGFCAIIECAATVTTSANTTTTKAAAEDLGWLIYMMGGVFACIGIILLGLIGFIVYLKCFKFRKQKKPIEVVERKESTKPVILVQTIGEEEEEEVEEELDKIQSPVPSSIKSLEPNRPETPSINSREKSLVVSPKPRTPNLSEDKASIRSVSSVSSSIASSNKTSIFFDIYLKKKFIKSINKKKIDALEKQQVEEIGSGNPNKNIDLSIFATRIAPHKFDSENALQRKPVKLFSPKASKIIPIPSSKTPVLVSKKRKSTKRKKISKSDRNKPIRASKFIDSPNELWYSVNPQIDNKKSREVKNVRKYAVFAYNHNLSDYIGQNTSEA